MRPFTTALRFDGMGSIIAEQGATGPRVMIDAHMGWDDGAGCAVLVEAMRRLNTAQHANHIFYAVTTQEEVGLRGAHTAADAIKADIGISVEGGITGDVFPTHPEETQAKLGAGPGIFLYDSYEIPNRKFAKFVKDTAAAKNILLQLDLVSGYGDDSAEIQKSNNGVPTVNLVVPVRYTHAHNGIMNRQDFDQMVELLVSIVQRLDEQAVRDIRNGWATFLWKVKRPLSEMPSNPQTCG